MSRSGGEGDDPRLRPISKQEVGAWDTPTDGMVAGNRGASEFYEWPAEYRAASLNDYVRSLLRWPSLWSWVKGRNNQ